MSQDTSINDPSLAGKRAGNRAGNRAQLGALDLGSNSFHLLVAQEANGRFQVLDKHKEMVRLAAGLDDKNRLTKEVRERALACLERFGQRLRPLNSSDVRIVGTNTLRKTDDTDFIREAQQVLGHKIEIISGREEARLIYLGVCHDMGASDHRRFVVDIGGGSTELIIGRRSEPELLESLHMGCVSMTQLHFADGKITAKAFKGAINHAMVELEPVAAAYQNLGWESSVGASGTINAVRSVLSARHQRDDISLLELEELMQTLIGFGDTDDIDLDGLADERKAVFPGGVAILLAVMQTLQIENLDTSQGALREGLIYDLIGRQHHTDIRDHTVQDLTRRFSIDNTQARQVRESAIALLSQVAADWSLTAPECKQLIAWAADLHEIGMDISHSGYHKHGAYLIENMDMPGFTRWEQQQLAILIRNHRRKLVTSQFEDQPETLLRLTVLLRLSVVLHRNRASTTLPHVAVKASDNELTISVDDAWLADHPLTALDLLNESNLLRSVNIEATLPGLHDE